MRYRIGTALLVLLLVGACSATDIYFAQASAGSNNGTSCANAYALTDGVHGINLVASQVAGNTLHLCGTFTSATQGGNLVTAVASGSAGNPITLTFETNAALNSTGWWGNYNSDACPTCNGAITINSQNYWIIDGGANGIIQNTLAGCLAGCTAGHAATCSAGTCTQSPAGNGSMGVHINGDHIIIRNLTVGPFYVNDGSGSGATDVGGTSTVGIRLDGDPTDLLIYNVHTTGARAGIWGNMDGALGENSCPSDQAHVTGLAGTVCIFNNLIEDGNWKIVANDGGSNNITNIYNNDMGGTAGWTNWQYPTGTYHQNGLFCWGSNTGKVETCNFYNNYVHGDLGAGSPSGLIYCANNGINASGTGCALVAFNNVIVATGGGASGSTGDQDFAFKFDCSGCTMGAPFLANNTVVNGKFADENYTTGTSAVAWTEYNNIYSMPGAGSWFSNNSNGGTIVTTMTANGNDYFNGGSTPWQLNASSFSTLATWKSACSCDAGAITSDPKLNVSAPPYTLQATSPDISLGVNLTSQGITALDSGAPQNFGIGGTCGTGCLARPSAGAWDAGALPFQAAASSPTPAPALGMFAEILIP